MGQGGWCKGRTYNGFLLLFELYLYYNQLGRYYFNFCHLVIKPYHFSYDFSLYVQAHQFSNKYLNSCDLVFLLFFFSVLKMSCLKPLWEDKTSFIDII